MIAGYGAKNALSKDIHYDQTRSFLELFLKDLKSSGQSKFWLETCNVHAMACAIDAVGGRWHHLLPVGGDGKPLFTQAAAMFIGLYSAWGQSAAPFVRDGVAENEVIANVAWIAEQLADVKATVITAVSGLELVEKMDASLKRGSANVLSYLTDYGSGHYITQVMRNKTEGSFTVMDPWPGNVHCKNGGVLEIYKDSFFSTRCDPARLRFIEVHAL